MKKINETSGIKVCRRLTGVGMAAIMMASVLSGCGNTLGGYNNSGNGDDVSIGDTANAGDAANLGGATSTENAANSGGAASAEDNTNTGDASAVGTSQTQPVDDSLTSLTGKKKDEENSKVEIPEDYVYSLDDMGFLDIGETASAIDDNYRNYYEIFVLSFYDSDGDGVGDINGVTEKLDYISEMGFNGIWLMPIMSSPSYHKYDTDDYYLVDPAYGTNEDFERLLKEAHERGIKIVIDFVINHTSSEHPWFTEACDYLRKLPEGEEPDVTECPYVDYYHFSREWSSGYCKVEGTDWYYEGVFNYTQPDLNYDSQKVKEEILKIAEYWIEMGVDGFRVDAAAHFEEGATDYNKEILSTIYEHCISLKPDFYMVSEVWLDEVTIANYYGSMTPSFFNFDSANSEGKLVKTAKGSMSAESFVTAMLKYQEDYSGSNPDYIDAVFITNHDMTRVANQLTNDADAMKMACGLMMSMQGSTFVYYGEEIGMKSSGSSDENKRIAMYWSDIDTVGMTDGPENAEKTIKSSFEAVDKQAENPDSIINYYRRALQLRTNFPALARGTMRIVDELTEENVAVVTKDYQDSEILIVYNTSTESERINLEGTEYEDWTVVGELTIHPWEKVEGEEAVYVLPARSIFVLSR